MCGIFGYSRLTKATAQLTGILAIYMNERGSSAAGWTNGDEIIKGTGSIVDKFLMPEWWHLPFAAHTRAPSVGANTNQNAHPFEWISGNRRVIGLHNGHISNWFTLKSKYTATRHAAEVDSQQIIAALAEGTPLEEIDGWGTVVWFDMTTDAPQDRTYHLSTFDRGDLAIAKLTTGELVYASTESSIRRAVHFADGTDIDFFYEIKKKTKYEIRGDELFLAGGLPWGEKPLAYQSQHHQGGTPQTGLSRFCKYRGCTNLLSKPDLQLICDACFEKALTDFLGEAVEEPKAETWVA